MRFIKQVFNNVKLIKMKRYLKVVIILVSFGIITSCEQPIEREKPEQNAENFSIDFKVENNMLNFATPDDYQKLLDSLAERGYNYFIHWDKSVNFQSLRSYYDGIDELNNLPVEDELLAVVLNPELKIKIGDYVFQLHPGNREVLVNQSNGDNKSVYLKTFSFDDAVIDQLFNIEALKSLDDCNYPSAPPQSYSWSCWGESIECLVKYYKAGIYNSIYVQMKLTNCIISGVEMHLDVDYQAYCVYDKCRRSKSLEFAASGVTCKIYENLYRKIDRVNECYLPVNFSALSADQSCNESASLTLEF